MDIGPHDVVGIWRIERRLVDLSGPRFGRMRGELIVSTDADAVRWEERGQLMWSGQIVAVTRNLAVRPIEGEWWMTFADGAPFHPWRPGQWVEHPCRADTYRGRLDVAADLNTMKLFWDVTGPAKAQRLFTRYGRIPV